MLEARHGSALGTLTLSHTKWFNMNYRPKYKCDKDKLPTEKNKKKILGHEKEKPEAVTVAHAFNPSTCEAEAGGSVVGRKVHPYALKLNRKVT